MAQVVDMKRKREPADKAAPEVLRAEEPQPSGEYVPAHYRPQWVPTVNERNLDVAMDVIRERSGKGCLVTVTGNAGYGKTETTLRFAAEHACVHLLMWETWKRPMPFIQALCREHGIEKPPRNTNDCLILLVDRLLDRVRREKRPAPVFLDEFDMALQHLNLVRQISEVTGTPFVLIGEQQALISHVTKAARSWSRTYQAVQFAPVALGDVILYPRKSAGLEVSAEAAGLIHKSACGEDWRDIERITINLVKLANHKRTRVVDPVMAETALKMALKGETAVNGVKAAQSPYVKK